MRIQYITNIQDIPISAIQWNNLVKQNETNTIFQTYEWIESWWQSCSERYELFILLVREKNKVIGIAPMMTEVRPCGRKQLSFIGDGNADYQDFILPIKKSFALNCIWDFLLSNPKLWDRIAFHNIPGASSSINLLKALSIDSKLRIIDNEKTKCPALSIHGDPEQVEKILNKYSNRRKYNYFNKLGVLTEKDITDIAELKSYLPVFFKQHIERWANTPYPSLFNEQKNQDFYEVLAEKLLPNKSLLFSVVELDGIPLSFHYGFDYNAKIIWYKPSFNMDYAKHSPGLLMIRHLLRHALANDKTELDFTIGDEAFKKRFTNTERYNYNIRIFKTWRSYLYAMLRKRLDRLKRFIQKESQ